MKQNHSDAKIDNFTNILTIFFRHLTVESAIKEENHLVLVIDFSVSTLITI